MLLFVTAVCDTPLHRLDAHQAAVKALAWCPWQKNLLASGGGTADRMIRFWNANNGRRYNNNWNYIRYDFVGRFKKYLCLDFKFCLTFFRCSWFTR